MPSIALARPEAPRLIPSTFQSIRCAATKNTKEKKKKKVRNTYRQYDLKHAEKFSLVDAMQYVSLLLPVMITGPSLHEGVWDGS